MLRQLGEDIWIADSPLGFFGVEIGARMTVMRVAGGKLLVHSPIAATEQLVRAVQELGEVAFLVAPNRFHHLFVGGWKQAFPDASVHVAPGLERKRADLDITSVLSDAPETGWAGTVDQVFMQGNPMTSEVVFFHRPSGTLVASDLAFNIGADSPWLTRAIFRLDGSYGRLCPSLLERVLVRDKAAFLGSLERVLDFPFERAIVAHGKVAEWGGREDLERGYSWILRARPEA